MAKKYIHLNIYSDYSSLISACKKEYLLNHPEMAAIKITDNKIFYELAKYYLKDTDFEDLFR